MESPVKKSLRRSNSYPSISLTEAIELASFISKNGGHQYIKLETIAKVANKSVGGMSQKVGSAVQYDLLEMKQGVGYRPSELFKKIQKPFSATEKHENLVEAFKSPKLYGELILKLNGNPIPSETILANILERDHSIFDEAAKKAAAIFLENIEELRLRNSHDELQFNNTEENDREEDRNVSTTPNSTTRGISEVEKNINIPDQGADLLKLEIGLTNGRKAIIFYPLEMTSLDIEIMKLQITVLEKIVDSNSTSLL